MSGASSSESNSAFSSFTQEPSRLLFQPDLQNNDQCNIHATVLYGSMHTALSMHAYSGLYRKLLYFYGNVAQKPQYCRQIPQIEVDIL